mgnify:CR=1 FL=1
MAHTFDALVIAPNSMMRSGLVHIIQGRCMICFPGTPLHGRSFDEIYAFGGEWELEEGAEDWLNALVRTRFNAPGKDIIWIR